MIVSGLKTLGETIKHIEDNVGYKVFYEGTGFEEVVPENEVVYIVYNFEQEPVDTYGNIQKTKITLNFKIMSTRSENVEYNPDAWGGTTSEMITVLNKLLNVLKQTFSDEARWYVSTISSDNTTAEIGVVVELIGLEYIGGKA